MAGILKDLQEDLISQVMILYLNQMVVFINIILNINPQIPITRIMEYPIRHIFTQKSPPPATLMNPVLPQHSAVLHLVRLPFSLILVSLSNRKLPLPTNSGAVHRHCRRIRLMTLPIKTIHSQEQQPQPLLPKVFTQAHVH